MKRRYLHIAVVAIFIAGLLPSCDLLEECGTCELVTEYADGTVERGTPLPFCGDALKEKRDSSPVEVAGVTTYWYCY
jgi:hypothetical protein